MGEELAPLLDRIRGLLDGRTGDPGLLLTEMEDTLTDGYARALGLESELLRMRKRAGSLAAEVSDANGAEELRGLMASMGDTQGELDLLRAQLADLRRRVDAARAQPEAV